MARGLKILTVCIDVNKPPVFWQHLQYIAYSSGQDFDVVLDGVLRFLGLPPETDDPVTRASKQVNFEMKVAYKNKEWATVTQKYLVVTQVYPHVISSSIYYMQAISLLEQGDKQQSQLMLSEGLMRENSEQDLDLLHDYAQLLVKNNSWEEVWHFSRQAVQRFPKDHLWYQLQEQALINLRGRTAFPSSDSGAQHFPFLRPAQNISTAAYSSADNQTRPLLHPEQSATLSSAITPIDTSDSLNTKKLNDFTSAIPYKLENVDAATSTSDRVTKQIAFDSDLLPRITQRLPDEEPQSNLKSSTWHTVNELTEQHLPDHRLSKLLWTPSWIFTLIINLLLLPLVFSIWPPSAWMIWLSTVATLLILAAGRIVGRKALAACRRERSRDLARG